MTATRCRCGHPRDWHLRDRFTCFGDEGECLCSAYKEDMMTDEPIEPGPPLNLSLLLPFDTDDPEFARGFEAGRIWSAIQALEEDDLPETFPMHATNAEMAIRIAESVGFKASCVVHDDRWIDVTFGAAE